MNIYPTDDEQGHAYRSGSLIVTRLAGVTFNGRQAVIARLNVGDPLLLRREPTNPYDRNAIRVECLNGQQVGYLNRQLAAQLAPFFDQHGQPSRSRVRNLTGSSQVGYSLSVVISFCVP